MNLNDLIGNRDSFASKLIREKSRRLVQHPAFEKHEQKDIEQELTLELVVKHKCFDRERASEVTFVARVIESKIISLIRNRTAEKRHFRRNSHSLNELVHDSGGGFVELVNTLEALSLKNHSGQNPRTSEEVSQLKHDVASVLKSLPIDLRFLAKLLMEKTEYAVSCELEVSRRQLANEVSRLREALEDSGLREYL